MARDLPERFIIKIVLMAFQVKVFHTVVHCPLLAEMIFDTPRLVGTITGSVNNHMKLEKRPEQIVIDFVALKKRREVFYCEGIDRFHRVYQ